MIPVVGEAPPGELRECAPPDVAEVLDVDFTVGVDLLVYFGVGVDVGVDVGFDVGAGLAVGDGLVALGPGLGLPAGESLAEGEGAAAVGVGWPALVAAETCGDGLVGWVRPPAVGAARAVVHCADGPGAAAPRVDSPGSTTPAPGETSVVTAELALVTAETAGMAEGTGTAGDWASGVLRLAEAHGSPRCLSPPGAGTEPPRAILESVRGNGP